MKKFVFTCGDINGIGPEIVVKTLNKIASAGRNKLYFFCPENIFQSVITKIPPSFNYRIAKRIEPDFSAQVLIISKGNRRNNPGKPTKTSGQTAYESIKDAFEMTATKQADAMITAPISKEAINMAGVNFPGHTEMLAEWSGTKNFAMMFLSQKMKAALVTIHEPIKKLPRLLTGKNLLNKIELLVSSLKNDFGIDGPKIALLGLNPHAGENGLIGKEEIDIIIPAIKQSGFAKFISGPFSPDAFWGSKNYKNYDLIVGMYHDQLLIPFKLLNFSKGVNYTAGLPIVRTSPDHGTAFEIATKFIADESSMLQAFYFAKKIVENRNKNSASS